MKIENQLRCSRLRRSPGLLENLQGVAAMGEHREGKPTLRSHAVEAKPPPSVDAEYIRVTREGLCMSAPVFARSLRLSSRILERWEQGQAPGDAASVLRQGNRSRPYAAASMT